MRCLVKGTVVHVSEEKMSRGGNGNPPKPFREVQLMQYAKNGSGELVKLRVWNGVGASLKRNSEAEFDAVVKAYAFKDKPGFAGVSVDVY